MIQALVEKFSALRHRPGSKTLKLATARNAGYRREAALKLRLPHSQQAAAEHHRPISEQLFAELPAEVGAVTARTQTTLAEDLRASLREMLPLPNA